ncbi:hypothetical protein PF011_g32104 [Phytophthora fragariae]|uniref:Uncharacterized protein n=1 Tax=Phytophthora fragariae TaxID=53985 RepID=A0A6A3GA57_9STRA|nr:hypothetical protein PF011_g32104 [Phytophthora fragariae]
MQRLVLLVALEAARKKPVHALPKVGHVEDAAEVCQHRVPATVALGAAMCNDAQAAEQICGLCGDPQPTVRASDPVVAFFQPRQLGLVPELPLGSSDGVQVGPHNVIVVKWTQ